MSIDEFATEFRTALENHASEQELAEIVLRSKAIGLTQQGIYSALTRIRDELCEQGRAETPVCELLEGIMERVWGYCGMNRRLWETSLPETKLE